MSSFSAVWSALDRDPLRQGIVQRRVRPDLPHDVFFVQKRPPGQRYIEMRLFGPVGSLWRKVKPSRGVNAEILPQSPSKCVLRVYESSHSQGQLFETVARDLVGQLSSSTAVSQVDRVCKRLLAWQAFFKATGTELSEEAQAGLVAELYILGILIDAWGAKQAIDGWVGPESAQQDFQHETLAIEVKSSRASGPISVEISSERQLDSQSLDYLLLVVVTLDARASGPGMSLPNIVSRCYDQISESDDLVNKFEERLLRAGYSSAHGDRYTISYEIREIHWFDVRGQFPRIVESMLATGVGSVRYRLSVAACDPWRLDTSAVDEILEEHACRR